MELMLILIMILSTHSLFYKSPILDSEIYVPDSLHLLHASLIDGAQPNDLQDVCLATSRLICVITLTLIYLIWFSISSFVLGINTQSLLEDCEHLILSSFHTEDSLPVYSCESIDMLIWSFGFWFRSIPVGWYTYNTTIHTIYHTSK